MARGSITARFARFARGLNTADGPYGLREGYVDDPTGLGAECRACLNVVSRRRGNVSKRDGCTELFAESAIKDMHALGQDSGSHLIYSTTGGALKARAATGTTETLATGLDGDALWSWVRLPVSGSAGPYYGFNGVDSPRESDGTAANTGTITFTSTGAVVSSPGTVNPRHAVYAGNRLFLAGDDSRPYSVFISEIGVPTDLQIEVKFNPDSTYRITGLGTVGPYVLVFTERQIHVIYDTETGANRTLVEGAGTLSPKSIVETPAGTFFLDPQRGVMATDGGSPPVALSDQIRPTVDSITSPDEVWALYDRGRYLLAASLSGSRRLLDYDLELKSWWLHGLAPTSLTVWDQGAGSKPYGAVPTGVWELFVEGELNDPDGIFESYWSGPFHTFGSPHLRKRGREVHFDARGTLDVYVAGDYEAGQGDLEDQLVFSEAGGTFGGSGTFGGAGTFGGTISIGEDSIYSFGVARAWSVTVYSAGEDYWELDAYTVLVDTRRD